MSWCGERFEIVPGVPKPAGRAHRNERDELSAMQNAAVCRAQEFSPKQCQENKVRKRENTAHKKHALTFYQMDAGFGGL